MSEIFTPKPFAEIAADMVERMRLSTERVTDFSVGSVVRSLLEAGAVELDDYYQEMYLGLLKAIPTAIYIGFGFDIRAASAATGSITITREATDAERTLEAGTRLVSLSGYYYVTDADVTFGVGEDEKTVLVTAEVEGSASNAGPNVLAFVSTQPDGLAATNPAVLAGGQDAETEEQRAERFAEFIRSLARGTPAALEYGAKIPAIYHPITGVLSERVQRASINETPGHVELYIHNGSYGASDELIAAVQQIVDGYKQNGEWVGGYRPAGMRVDVELMTDLAIDVSLEVTGTASATAIEEAVALYLHDTVPGVEVRPVDIINVVFSVDGVNSVTIIEPTTSFTVQPNNVLFLNNFTLS